MVSQIAERDSDNQPLHDEGIDTATALAVICFVVTARGCSRNPVSHDRPAVTFCFSWVN